MLGLDFIGIEFGNGYFRRCLVWYFELKFVGLGMLLFL